MQNKALISALTDEYAEKLFYFCLKKTGDSFEAEDLTSDILVSILSALQKGTEPSNFSAYVWQIARNRYAAWAKLTASALPLPFARRIILRALNTL